MTAKNILIVIKNKNRAEQLSSLLEHEGYQLFDTHRIDMATTLLNTHIFSGLILEKGYEKLENLQPHTAVYLCDSEQQEKILLESRRGSLQSPTLTSLLRRNFTSTEIVEEAFGNELLHQALKAAQSHADIMLTGESGTGKEVLAKWIESRSLRHGKPFVKINCAAIPDMLLESELFGHEKGAFTGAIERRIGKFEAAHRGTLLLDEVSEMPLTLQAKLLRVLQEREFERIGSNEPISIDVRIIATSNRNLIDAVNQRLFREDLLYRLRVVHLQIPPLRERKEAIEKLTNAFLTKHSQRHGKQPVPITGEQLNLLHAQSWQGNVRELSNVIERWVVLEQLDLAQSSAFPTTSPLALAEVEKRHILQTLQTNLGNRELTARVLDISTRTLRNKLKLYQGEQSSFIQG